MATTIQPAPTNGFFLRCIMSQSQTFRKPACLEHAILHLFDRFFNKESVPNTGDLRCMFHFLTPTFRIYHRAGNCRLQSSIQITLCTQLTNCEINGERTFLQIHRLRYIAMKFGRNYFKHQIAEWADAYMNYAALKRLCKESSASTNLQGKRQIRKFINCLFP